MICSGSVRCLTRRTGGYDLTAVPPGTRRPVRRSASSRCARLIVCHLLCLTCADLPAADHLRSGRRGSHAGTFGPLILTWANVGARLVLGVMVWPGAGQGMAGFPGLPGRGRVLWGPGAGRAGYGPLSRARRASAWSWEKMASLTRRLSARGFFGALALGQFPLVAMAWVVLSRGASGTRQGSGPPAAGSTRACRASPRHAAG
jgi:hypothetical protein